MLSLSPPSCPNGTVPVEQQVGHIATAMTDALRLASPRPGDPTPLLHRLLPEEPPPRQRGLRSLLTHRQRTPTPPLPRGDEDNDMEKENEVGAEEEEEQVARRVDLN